MQHHKLLLLTVNVFSEFINIISCGVVKYNKLLSKRNTFLVYNNSNYSYEKSITSNSTYLNEIIIACW